MLTFNKLVIVDNYLLVNETEFNVSHFTNNTNITFLTKLYDTQRVMIDLFIDEFNPYEYYDRMFVGFGADGTDGQVNRTLFLTNSELPVYEIVEVDSFYLIRNSDYVITKSDGSTRIKFLNELFNTQKINVRYYQDES